MSNDCLKKTQKNKVIKNNKPLQNKNTLNFKECFFYVFLTKKNKQVKKTNVFLLKKHCLF